MTRIDGNANIEMLGLILIAWFPTSIRMTRDGAKRREAGKLATYRRGHTGHNPKYNKDDDG